MRIETVKKIIRYSPIFLILLANSLFSQEPAGQTHPQARDYFAPLKESEKADIRYIITTLSGKSTFSLLFYKDSLHKTGNRVDYIHPLKFLLFIFTDNRTKRAVKRINSYPWKRFVSGMGESFDNAARRDNIKDEFIDDFADRVGISRDAIYPLLQKKAWTKFMYMLRDR